MGFFEQQLSVRAQLVSSAQQGSNAMYKLWNEASVGVVCLAVVISHNLECENNKPKGSELLKTQKEHVRKIRQECGLALAL